MTTLRQAAELALEAMKDFDYDKRMAAIEAVEKALAEPQWIGLTGDEIFECENNTPDEVISDREYCIYFARAIEATLKEKNT